MPNFTLLRIIQKSIGKRNYYKILTPENFILKLGTRDYVDNVTFQTIFDVNRFNGALSPKYVKYHPS